MVNLTKPPVIISPNLHKSAESLSALLDRFNMYGAEVCKLSNGSIEKIVLLAGIAANQIDLEDVAKYKYLEVIRVCNPSRNIFRFAYLSRKSLRDQSIEPRMLIASDLYFGFMASYLIFLILRISLPIQISVHGSVLRGDDSIFKNKLRKRYIAIVFQLASSIRFVSKELESQTFYDLKIYPEKSFIAPIPIDFPNTLDCKKSRNIAFVGRFHEERGVEEWVNLVCSLSKIRQDFSVYLIGQGPLHNFLISSLNRDAPGLPLINCGYLTRPEMNAIWPEIKIFLSSAKREGYGLSLREAILASAFVVARSSSGSEVLRNEFPDLVYTYHEEIEAVAQLDLLLDANFPKNEAESFRAKMLSRNGDALNALASSWLRSH